MKTITVYLPVWAEYAIDVEVSDETFEAGEFDEAIDQAYELLPSGLCYGCSTGNSGGGWTKRAPVNLELGDSPEVRYIMDEDGNTVWGNPNDKLGW